MSYYLIVHAMGSDLQNSDIQYTERHFLTDKAYESFILYINKHGKNKVKILAFRPEEINELTCCNATKSNTELDGEKLARSILSH